MPDFVTALDFKIKVYVGFLWNDFIGFPYVGYDS
jgi:hypothetical protein